MRSLSTQASSTAERSPSGGALAQRVAPFSDRFKLSFSAVFAGSEVKQALAKRSGGA
jgi:hypothetical protein